METAYGVRWLVTRRLISGGCDEQGTAHSGNRAPSRRGFLSSQRAGDVVALAGDRPREKLWELPDGVNIMGLPPERFGFHVQRMGRDAYAVPRAVESDVFQLGGAVADATTVQLPSAPLLTTLGTDLWCLLEQPQRGYQTLSRAA